MIYCKLRSGKSTNLTKTINSNNNIVIRRLIRPLNLPAKPCHANASPVT